MNSVSHPNNHDGYDNIAAVQQVCRIAKIFNGSVFMDG
jgi:hypothetical protein